LLDEKLAKSQGRFAGWRAWAFKLYDTFGFSVGFNARRAAWPCLSVDQKVSTTAMEKQESRGAQKLDRLGRSCDDRVWFELREKIGATDFLGYDTEKAEGVITALVLMAAGNRAKPRPESRQLC